ncbi:hypothetical protein E4U21_003380 [Claviceps maximensis]|nr:hypothetical protein E4U21_003380 [Claviceps maximensis]
MAEQPQRLLDCRHRTFQTDHDFRPAAAMSVVPSSFWAWRRAVLRPRRATRALYMAVLTAAVLFLFARRLPPSSSPPPPPGREIDALRRLINGAGHDALPAVAANKSSFDWAAVPMAYLPPAAVSPLPPPPPEPRLPPVQHDFARESSSQSALRHERRDHVRRVFVDDWQNYRTYAWRRDALNPISATAKDQFSGWAATLVDSLDTLWLMGLRDEFREAVAAVAAIDFGVTTHSSVNIFETNIRYLGGLLAAYDLSGSDVLLAKAVELGNLIYAGFNTPNQMPVDFIHFETAKLGTGLEVESSVVSASPGTLSLEMTRLSQVTGDPKYYDATARVMRVFHDQQNKTKLPGLWPIRVSMRRRDVASGSAFSLGGGADSLFEYLPKMHALLGGQDAMYETMTTDFIKAATAHLLFRPMVPGEQDILIAGNVDVNSDGDALLDPESSHLACFIGGTIALAGRLLGQPEHVDVGAKLAKGCAYAYTSFPSGVMPETYKMVPCEPRTASTCPWNETRWLDQRTGSEVPKGFISARDPRYLLRPEAIESIFILYRITGEQEYQETAWDMFQAVEKATRAKFGHAALRDVTTVFDETTKEDNQEDYMESFWLAETLKYYYLIFSPPDLIDLDEFVLNTEAHPFRRPR